MFLASPPSLSEVAPACLTPTIEADAADKNPIAVTPASPQAVRDFACWRVQALVR